jgi:protein TonB
MALRAPQLDFEDDPWGKPALGSLALHAGIFVALVLYAVILAHIHGSAWGQRSDTAGAIQATMVSSAPAIPLPQTETPKPDQVLATETPSQAPAPPAPKAQKADAQDSIAIPVKQKVKTKLEPKKQVEQTKEMKVPERHVRMVPAPTQPQQVQLQHRAAYGATQAYTPKSMAQAQPAAQVQVQGGNFGAMYGWYVDKIRRLTAQNWYLQEVSAGTPVGAKVYLTFRLDRGGAPSDVRVQQSSGSPTLDSTCVQAVERVQSYGPLPSGYNGSSLLVQYYCEKPGS